MTIQFNNNTDTITASGGSGALVGFPVNGFKNRIINGAMMIDQRDAGASVTPTNGQYTLDRFCSVMTQASKYTVQQNAGSVTPPMGFKNYLGITSSSAYAVLTGDTFSQRHSIEGFNTFDLGWGAVGASSVTLSFWARSSLTGTFGGSVSNAAVNRCYVFSYTINSANTWEYKTITIAGDTTGTWATDNTVGIRIDFSLGAGSTYTAAAGSWGGTYYTNPTGGQSVVGTNGATFYITGVQLEKGSTATSFDYRPYGTELALCQRYYEKSYDMGTVPATAGATSGAIGFRNGGGANIVATAMYRVTKRAAASVTFYATNTGNSGYASNRDNAGANVAMNGLDGGTQGVNFTIGIGANTNWASFQYVAEAEL